MPHEFDNPRPPAEDGRMEVRVTKPESVAVAGAPSQPAPIIINIPPGALQWQPAPEGAQNSPRKP